MYFMDNRLENRKFKDLENGDAFTCDTVKGVKKVFIKIESVNIGEHTAMPKNAVQTDTGWLDFFDGDMNVQYCEHAVIMLGGIKEE